MALKWEANGQDIFGVRRLVAAFAEVLGLGSLVLATFTPARSASEGRSADGLPSRHRFVRVFRYRVSVNHSAYPLPEGLSKGCRPLFGLLYRQNQHSEWRAN